jgi:hypothetical protein
MFCISMACVKRYLHCKGDWNTPVILNDVVLRNDVWYTSANFCIYARVICII